MDSFTGRLAPAAARQSSRSRRVPRRAPAQVRELLATRAASAEEKAALAALTPVFQGCVASGTQARMSRYALRPLFALGLYRLTIHAAGPKV